MLVADCDGEPSEVGSDDLDGLVQPAGDLQALPLALVGRLVARSVGADSCNNRKKLFYIRYEMVLRL